MPHAVYREDAVARLMAALEGPRKAAVLEAPAGMGKTTVALEVAWELCARGRCTGGAFMLDFAGGCPLVWAAV
jgi:superfamily II DNA or RNA helicase